MPEVARLALVSEATAYRYFPDLVSLLGEAIDGLWPSPGEALRPVASSRDPDDAIASAVRTAAAVTGAAFRAGPAAASA